MERRSAFCINCHRETACMPRKVKINQSVRDKSYTFEITTFVCSECGREIGFPGLMDYNIKEMDEQYRKAEEIITVEDINRLMKLYNIGKAPLSLALGRTGAVQRVLGYHAARIGIGFLYEGTAGPKP